MHAQKTAFFDIGGTLGNVKQLQSAGTLTTGFPISPTLRLEVSPTVEDSLQELRANGIQLSVVSKIYGYAPSAVTQMLENCGLLQYFKSELLFYIEGEQPKNAEAFSSILKKAGLANADRTVFVGENALERAQAQLAGMRVIDLPSKALLVLTAMKYPAF